MTKVRLSIFQTSGKKRKHLFVTEIGGWVWKKIVFQNRPRKVYKRGLVSNEGKERGQVGRGLGENSLKRHSLRILETKGICNFISRPTRRAPRAKVLSTMIYIGNILSLCLPGFSNRRSNQRWSQREACRSTYSRFESRHEVRQRNSISKVGPVYSLQTRLFNCLDIIASSKYNLFDFYLKKVSTFPLEDGT